MAESAQKLCFVAEDLCLTYRHFVSEFFECSAVKKKKEKTNIVAISIGPCGGR
jgi:hypothetical protein